ncbi:unnamed protein product [Leptidea sinapis]|uniref:Uncharacterized protein n=1 Tax=Leptidea sinapis TaxID=189913 RepID=A0A5E4R3J9_9NEOP|nr:unnamed protein product [Leptidea sinapis]
MHLATCVIIACTYLAVKATHIFNVERDFSRLSKDAELSKYVHPRIRLFYQLLKRGMMDYRQKHSDSLYNPEAYQVKDHNLETNTGS